jgi:DNA-binding response OmpR family regulator
MLRRRLEALAYRVVECSDGLAVLAKTRTQRVDALILDHEMPLGEGRAIAQSVRSYSRAPIIFLSGHNRDDFREAVMRLPDTYYLPKPLDSEKLAQLLASVLSRPAETNGGEHAECAAGPGPAAHPPGVEAAKHLPCQHEVLP